MAHSQSHSVNGKAPFLYDKCSMPRKHLKVFSPLLSHTWLLPLAVFLKMRIEWRCWESDLVFLIPKFIVCDSTETFLCFKNKNIFCTSVKKKINQYNTFMRSFQVRNDPVSILAGKFLSLWLGFACLSIISQITLCNACPDVKIPCLYSIQRVRKFW